MIYGSLYIITNGINDKKYIGKTYKSVQQRWQEHLKEKNKDRCKNRPLYRAMNKYGIENFSIDLINKFPKGILEEKEKEYIKEFNTYGNTGYNATLGGDGKPYLNLNEKDVIIQYNNMGLIYKVALYFNCSQDSIRLILKNNSIVIKPGSLITKEKKGKKVLQLTKDLKNVQEFNSYMEAAIWLVNNRHTTSENLTRIAQNIGRCIKGIEGRKSAYGFIWKNGGVAESGLLQRS